MASNTPNINLYKKDPVADGNDTFNIKTMLNDNWDKIDSEIGDIKSGIEAIEYPVTSVNNKTGDVVLNAADIGAETPVGSQAKANMAETNANDYTDQEISSLTQTINQSLNNKIDKITGKGLSTNDYTTAEKNKLAGLPTDAVNAIATGSNADPNTTQESYILTNHANSPGGGAYWHIQTLFYSSKTGNRAQIAVRYNGDIDEMYIRSCYSNVWTTWKRAYHDGNLTKAAIDLGNVLNYGIATKAEAESGASNTKYMTPLRVKEAISVLAGNAKVASGSFVGDSVAGRTIIIGFRPKFIMISKPYYHFLWGNSSETRCIAPGALNELRGEITATFEGFRLWNKFSSGTHLHTNENGKIIDWVAIG